MKTVAAALAAVAALGGCVAVPVVEPAPVVVGYYAPPPVMVYHGHYYSPPRYSGPRHWHRHAPRHPAPHRYRR